MNPTQKPTIFKLFLGVGFGLIYSILFSESPWLQKLELTIYDALLRWHSPSDPPQEIVLVKLDRKYRDSRVVYPDFSERVFYTSLVKQLLQHDAAVVVLNLRHYWRDVPDTDWKNAEASNSPLKELVEDYSDRLVLVTPTYSLLSASQTELQLYHHFLPHEDDFSKLLTSASIQGFSEYELEAEQPVSVNSIARRVNLRGQFVTVDGLELKQKFYSAPLLALKKYNRHQNDYDLEIETTFPQTIRVNYWNDTNIFSALSVEQICVNDAIAQCRVSPGLNLHSRVANKIILVGFTEGRNLNTLCVESPFGKTISLVEYQTQILSNLIANRYYRILPIWSTWSIYLIGSVIVSRTFIFKINLSQTAHRQSLFWYLFWFVSIYIVLALILWQHYLTLPIVIPLSIWSATTISIYIYLMVEQQQKLIIQQRRKIERLQQAEAKAVILQTRKLLQRVASDLHDTALQDMKVLMDRLELDSNLDSEVVLDHLESIGSQVREQLQLMRNLSQNLEISPVLRSGLDIGIRAYLEQLINSGQLSLQVIYTLYPINEPIANSAWIDAREDIYRFFREAINNIMFHAQTPHGNATEVRVSLWREQNQCYLVITDNNSQTSVNLPLKNSLKRFYCGGYGTKIMETIASELPEGIWDRTIIPEGGVKVQLSWCFKKYVNSDQQ